MSSLTSKSILATTALAILLVATAPANAGSAASENARKQQSNSANKAAASPGIPYWLLTWHIWF